MLSNDKLANYNNIQVSVEKLTNEKIKVTVIEVLRELSDEELQKINDHSDILDKILRGIECFNKKDTRLIYGKSSIQQIISLFSQGRYDRIMDVNPNVLELLISYGSSTVNYSFNYNNDGSNWNNFSHLNDNKFCRLTKDEAFCKALLKIDRITYFLSISIYDDVISNEDFKECINNQDLILVYCCTNKDHKIYSLKGLMISPNRNSMINKLYSLQQEGKLRCDKKTLDLILLNLPIIKQLVYSDANGDVIKTLESNDYEEIKLLFEQVQGVIRQEIGQNIQLIKYPDECTFHDKNLQYDIGSISLLQTHCAAKFIKDREISAKLCQTQVTQGTSNLRSLT